MTIAKAQLNEAQTLTDLTIRSKSYWGYSPELIASWQAELTITPAYIEDNIVFVLKQEETLLGYYAFFLPEKDTIELNNMFIDPAYIGKGYGKTLMQHFIEQIKKQGIKRILLYAEPHAEEFYQKQGFQTIDQYKSSVKGRFLPIMEMRLA